MNHVHKFKKFTYPSNKTSVFHCILPDCNFKIEVPFALGKRAICNRCGDEFIMNEKSLRRKFPHCENCTKRKTIVNGEIKYVVPRVFSSIIDDKVSDLKNRVESVVQEMKDEDI